MGTIDELDEEAETTLGTFETENPWLQKAFGMAGYGQAPVRAIQLLRDVSPDTEERIITALKVKHGSMRRGYLIATTAHLRWVQTFPGRSDDYWSYEYKIDVRGGLGQGGIIEVISGDLFQIRWRRAKQFRELYSVLQQAAAWEVEHQTTAHPATSTPGLGEEIQKLAALREQGVLTDDEFSAAKQRLLSPSTPER